MRNIRTSIFISLLGVFLLCGCKEKKTTGFEYLEHLVEEINTQSDKTFDNGTILEKCEYQQGDRVFVFQVKVPDNRFDNVDGDSLKNSIAADLSSQKMHKLTNTLAKNAIGIKYIFEQNEKEIAIEFTLPELLKQK